MLIQIKAGPKGALNLGSMTVLSQDDQAFFDRFFVRALQLHASGVVTTESAVDYLSRAIGAVDRQTPAALAEVRAVLDQAWLEAND